MKIDKKKPHGMKRKIREKKKRERRIALAVTSAILIISVSVSGFLINSMLNQPSTNLATSGTSQPKAAIVDHLSLTAPNQTFIQTATNILKQAGFTVDYYPGEEVTVEFYRNLPAHYYNLIILRVHSSATAQTGEQQYPVHLWTSELYSTSKYLYEQLTDQLGVVTPLGDERRFFAIGPQFVRRSMKGSFKNATIIPMGCDGLRNPEMAEAFIEKGAKVYISWDKLVLASHTDQATIYLLQQLLIERQKVKKAVEETMKEVGPDPIYNSQLLYYPLEAGDHTIQNIIGIIITNNTTKIKYTHHREEFDNL